MNPENPFSGRGDLTLSGFLAAALVAVALVCAAWWLSVQQSRAAAWVSHSHEVLTSIARTRTALVDIQNGVRGFVVSGREDDLQPYLQARSAVVEETQRLRTLVADNPLQLRHVAELDGDLPARLAVAAEVVAARRRGGLGDTRAILESGLPQAQMARMRGVLQAMQAEEERLLGEHLAEHERRLEWFWTGITAVVLGLFAALGVLYQQVRRRRVEQRQLLESEQQFHLMADSVLDYAIIMLDPQGQVRTWNAGAQRITGHDARAILGRDVAGFYTPESVRDERPTRTLQAAASHGRHAEECWLVRCGGSRFWASVVMTPLRDRHGDLRGFCMIARDLTERRQAEEALLAEMQERRRIDEQLQELNRSLEGSVRERTAELSAANADLLEAKARLHDLSSQLILAQEQERRHIARELHDETGQSLTVIRMHLMDMMRGAEGAAARIPDCLGVVDHAIAQIRGLALNLRPTMLDDLGLVDALQWALDQQAKAAGWTTAFESDGEFSAVPSDIQTACFRIGQEALTNAARHAQAGEVSVELRTVGGTLELTVFDDGRGFDLRRFSSPEERKRHFGLMSMSERASLVGGHLDIQTSDGGGTRVRATFPLPEDAAAAEVDSAAARGAG